MAHALALALLVAQAPPTLTLKYDQVPVPKVLEVFELSCKARIDLDPLYRSRKVSLRLHKAELPAALRKLANDLGAVVEPRGRDHFEILPAWKRDLRAKLETVEVPDLQQRMGLASLRDTIALVGNVTRVNIVVDPALDLGRNSLDMVVSGVTLKQLLDLVTEPNGLAYDLRYGVVFVARPGRLKQLPLALATSTPDDRKITAEFKGVTIDKAIAVVAKQSGLAIDPPRPVPATTLRLAIRDVTPGQALALLTLPLGLGVEKTEQGLRVR